MLIHRKLDTQVLLLYDELESGLYAKKVFDHITDKLCQEIKFTYQIWNFEAIHIPLINESVYTSALNADVIAFAVKEDHFIADWILQWTESWLRFKEAYSCAFVGILVNPDIWPSISPDSPNLNRLREIADEGHFSFFTQNMFPSSPIALPEECL